MQVKLILRLVMAIIFAITAVIFSELIPPIEGVDQIVLRILVTLSSAGVGFILFPEIATKVSITTVAFFNFVVHRLASEILSQLMRLPRGSVHLPPMMNPTPQVGAVSLTKPVILDTSAIIDGRILDIAKVGFISGLILVPNFVLVELQQVADSSDELKRGRGRRGFETISELKRVKGVKVEIWDREVVAKSVDEKLVRLGKTLAGKVVTTDFNLNRLAQAHSVTVLNVNDLANAVKTVALPGEKIEIKVAHLGKNNSQGVGYLADGTMVVVEDGANLIGKEVSVEVIKVLQVSAGRMIFSKKISSARL